MSHRVQDHHPDCDFQFEQYRWERNCGAVRNPGALTPDYLKTRVFPVLTLDDYQKRAGQFARYPGQGEPAGLFYLALKMNGEAGEFAEHLGKALRDDGFPTERLTPARRMALKKELGDVLWYVAKSADELGFDLSEIADENLAKLTDRAARGVLQGSGDDR